jgi:hypothetical protein
VPLLDGLKAFYQFENNGNDSHNVGPYHLSAVNGPTLDTGKVGQALELDGANFPNVQSMRVNSNADLENGDIDFSYGLWVFLNSDPGEDRYVFGRWGSSVGTFRSCYLQWADAFNLLRLVVGDGSGQADVYSAETITPGTWYYVQCGHRATADQIWISINGNTQSTPTNHSTGVLAGSARLNIGGLDTDNGDLTDKGWPGLVDQFGYWKRDIYDDRATLYNGGAGLTYAQMSGGGGGAMPFRTTLDSFIRRRSGLYVPRAVI